MARRAPERIISQGPLPRDAATPRATPDWLVVAVQYSKESDWPGYYLRVYPESRGAGGVTRVPLSGLCRLIEPAPRYSRKQLEAMEPPFTAIEELTAEALALRARRAASAGRERGEKE